MQAAREISVDHWTGAAGKLDEQRLVQAILAGDRSAFDDFARSHSPLVSSVVRRLVTDPNEQEDVVQETFIRAYQHLRRFRGQSSLRTWLAQIALNVCRDRRRAFWKRRVVLTGDPGQLPPTPERSSSFSDRSVLQQTIEAAVADLPEKLRLPFALHAFDELSGIEIAAILGCTESTVWTRIYTARKRLQASLAGVLER
jgi:RNA polymerase sigma factor (sigma-70 family)